MGREKKMEKGARMPPFVAMPIFLITSKAFTTLPFAASKALVYFRNKPQLPFNDPQYYKAKFPFSYSEAEGLGFSKGTFAKVIRTLVAYGFLDPVTKGGLRGDRKSMSQFRLSNRYLNYGGQNFKQISWGEFIP